ncbi:hypothetical protein CRG98_027898 [Punica granatum]|uniref:Uncharacterized protein n=1 Tax=Punica granatum TaxID=22663 RepID=A0A2I0J667_PUNGR|nr:hypothetical protein CRG98_027898 [Punica granatum]
MITGDVASAQPNRMPMPVRSPPNTCDSELLLSVSWSWMSAAAQQSTSPLPPVNIFALGAAMNECNIIKLKIEFGSLGGEKIVSFSSLEICLCTRLARLGHYSECDQRFI